MDKEIEKEDSSNNEDLALIEAFNAQNSDSFDKLVLKYQDLVFNICYRFIGDYEEANDCAQDIFVKVFSALGKFKGESKFSTWLYSIAINTCKNKVSSFGFRIRRKFFRLDALI
jgi:RNA polymerase sigma-70 factor, ECF subfamily